MTVKITTANGGSDSLDFGCAQTAIVATVTGTEVSSGEGKLELKTTTGGTSAAKLTIAANGTVTLAAPLPVASGGTGSTTGAIYIQTEVASTSGATIDWDIPAGVRRITMHFADVSTSGTSKMMVQIGPSGGVETSGYISTASLQGANDLAIAAGFSLNYNHSAAEVYYGRISFELGFPATNGWNIMGTLRRVSGLDNTFYGGSKPLAGELRKIRLTTEGGSETFDAGLVNISWEF